MFGINQLWVSNASPLFFYSPANEYFAGDSGGTASWTGQLDPAGGTCNDTVRLTSGPSGVMIPAIYGESGLGDCVPLESHNVDEGIATTFSPVFDCPPSYASFFAAGTGSDIVWESGQTHEFENEFNPQTFVLHFSCKSQKQCEGEKVGFKGAWIGTKYGPDE